MLTLPRISLASLLLAATACGDAGEATGPVTVTVYLGESTAGPDVPVVFSHADGSVAEVVRTGADGKATASLEAGGAVTWVDESYIAPRLQTVLDVEPGDEIELGFKAPPRTFLGTLAVRVPPIAGAIWYEARTPCGGQMMGSLPIRIDVFSDCAVESGDVLMRAWNGTYTNLTDVRIMGDGEVMLPPTWRSPKDFVVAFANIDLDAIAEVSVERWTPLGVGSPVRASATEPSLSLTLPAVEEASTATLGVTVSHTPEPNARYLQYQRTNVRVAGAAAAYEYDLATALRPWISATLDLNTPTIHVQAPEGTTADLAHISLTTVGNRGPCSWEIVGPARADLRVPTLPDEFAECNLSVGGRIEENQVAYLWWSELRDYDRVRPRVIELLARFGEEAPPDASVSAAPLRR